MQIQNQKFLNSSSFFDNREAPENKKESSHSAHGNGMNETLSSNRYVLQILTFTLRTTLASVTSWCNPTNPSNPITGLDRP
jgi:hypothetical protein